MADLDVKEMRRLADAIPPAAEAHKAAAIIRDRLAAFTVLAQAERAFYGYFTGRQRTILEALERAERVEAALEAASRRGIDGDPTPFERWWFTFSLGRVDTEKQGIGEDAWIAACAFIRAALAAAPAEEDDPA